ncbi:hypothetical protein H0A36_25350 [Endozoicomonas sp. SM1973]|uniref:Lipoprotein n=1 Tax=Spartinivicinus marinus TaxID=2994442 RepID=A0A853I912_9GAMM|nr:hypothetical protein [Spartinivicinus marinus]NYZ69349.1 hypothetical protein [Spartinivicinus marinus]
MRKHAVVVTVSLFIASCAMNKTAPNLPNNISLTPPGSYGQQYIQQIDFNYPYESKAKANAAKCVAMNVSNKSVVISDSSNSFVGSYTGNYYHINKSKSLSGGQVTQYSDKDSGVVVADGRTEAFFTIMGMPNAKIIDYKLVVDASGKDIAIGFSDIKTTMKETGYASNSGPTPLGAWSGAKPMLAYNSLKSIADKVARCMKR